MIVFINPKLDPKSRKIISISAFIMLIVMALAFIVAIVALFLALEM